MKTVRDYCTYAYLREDNTPYYIGKGKGDRAYKKRKDGINPPTDNTKIVLLKQNITEEEAFKHEIYMIFVFGRRDLNTGILRNKTNGGEGVSGITYNEEIRKRMSQSKIGKNNPMYGKKHSEDTKRKIGENQKGINHHRYGKFLSEEHKQKLREKSKGNFHSEDTKRKISQALKGKSHYRYGKFLSEEHKQKIRQSLVGIHNPMYGKRHSEETKKKISQKQIGENSPFYKTKWWNDGCGNCKRSKICPGNGWVLGRNTTQKTHK